MTWSGWITSRFDPTHKLPQQLLRGKLDGMKLLDRIVGWIRCATKPIQSLVSSRTGSNAPMKVERVWDDKSRAEMRDTLRWVVLGELRLAKNDTGDILNICREVYLIDECPEAEIEEFVQFAASEIDRITTKIDGEKAAWPNETDCDRLDCVEQALRERGILLWQVSPCCDTCTCAELSDRIEVINQRYPGFGDRVRGYAFFIDQNMPEALAEDTQLMICLGYGACLPNGSEIPKRRYEKSALGIAQEVCECLRDENFVVEWGGELSRKICLSLNWQRRTMLE